METKKRMSNRDKMVLFIIGAVALLAVVYFFVFTKKNEQRAELVAENSTLEEEVRRLETMQAQKEAVLADTAAVQKSIQETLERFPSEVNTEDVIYDMNDMYERIDGVKIESESFNMNQLFYQGGSLLDTVSSETVVPQVNNASVAAITSDTPVQDIVSAAANYTGYRSDVSVVFEAPYKSLKKVVDYINDSKDRMTITNLTMAKEDDSKKLSCTMALSMYSVYGTGKEYEEPKVGSGNVGVDNIFNGKR